MKKGLQVLQFGRFFQSIVESGTLASMSNHAMRIYLVLLRYADYTTGRCWPSRSTILEAAGVNKNHFHGALVELNRAGLLDFKRMGPQRHYMNTYVVHLPPKIAHAVATNCPPNKDNCDVHIVGRSSFKNHYGLGIADMGIGPRVQDKEGEGKIQIDDIDDPDLKEKLRSLGRTLTQREEMDRKKEV